VIYNKIANQEIQSARDSEALDFSLPKDVSENKNKVSLNRRHMYAHDMDEQY
jgi:hypothetical protein